jgi:hypothetical protein
MNKQPTALLSSEELAALSSKIGAQADRLIETISIRLKPKRPFAAASSGRGRPAKAINNPFHGYFGPTSTWGAYPWWAMDVLEGIARLDWHDRSSASGGKSMPLSLSTLLLVLTSLAEVSTLTVGNLTGLAERHARRYVKAVELSVPYLLRSRPAEIVAEMEGEDSPTYGQHGWADIASMLPPYDQHRAILAATLGSDALGITAAL